MKKKWLKRSVVLAVVASLCVPVTASAWYLTFSGVMGPGGQASEASGYWAKARSKIEGTYYSGRSYRTGFAVDCCGGSSFYLGSDWTAGLNFQYQNVNFTYGQDRHGLCGRYNSGTGSTTVSCYSEN